MLFDPVMDPKEFFSIFFLKVLEKLSLATLSVSLYDKRSPHRKMRKFIKVSSISGERKVADTRGWHQSVSLEKVDKPI